jgi:uncharacterized membrane protein
VIGVEPVSKLGLGSAVTVARTRSASVARRVVYGGTIAYAALFFGAALLHFLAFRSAHLDLGTMTQSVWSTAHGHFLEMTSGRDGRQTMRFEYHVDPFLALLVPLWWLWSSGVMLIALQAVAVSAGALPVFWLARKHLGSERAAAHFAFAYLLFPATQFNAFTISSGFHSVAIAVPLILFAIWFLDEERLVPFAIVAALAATTKEEIPAAIGCLGIWYAVRHRKRLTGAVILVVGVAITLVNFMVIIPHYSPTGASPYESRYTDIGATPTGMLHRVFTDPVALVHTVATGHKLFYVLLLLGPFLGLWLREPLLFLGAIPDLTVNLLSSLGDQTQIEYHWTAGIVPFTVAASILGAGRIRRDKNQLSLWVLCAVAAIALISPIYLSLGRGDIRAALGSNPVRSAKSAALAVVPPGVPVTASNQLGTYVAARRYSYVFPFVGKARWAVLDPKDPTYGDQAGYRRAIRRFERRADWRTVFVSHGIVVLRKTTASTG